MMPLLATLSPNAAVLLLTLGLALIALEVNRPGIVLPGAFGLLISLLGLASLLHQHPAPWAIALLLVAALVLLLQARFHVPLWIACIATAAVAIGFAEIVPPIRLVTAILCGFFLGAGTTVLTRIAHRARRNKGLD